jgi:predicted DNA-binding transcriptional regulator
MSKDQAIGAAILVASAVGLVVYAYLLYMFPTIVLQLTAFVGVALVLVILGWIGWTMATTPPPAPLDMEGPKTGMGEESSKSSESSDSSS